MAADLAYRLFNVLDENNREARKSTNGPFMNLISKYLIKLHGPVRPLATSPFGTVILTVHAVEKFSGKSNIAISTRSVAALSVRFLQRGERYWSYCLRLYESTSPAAS